MAEMQIVLFSLNNEICGVETSQVHKIEKYQAVTQIPEMPGFIEGIINLRGTIVPVINLNKRFGLGESIINKKTKIIVCDVARELIGFVVNDVSEIIKLSDSDIEQTPELINRSGNSYLKSVGKKGDKLISIFDMGGILNSLEYEELKEKIESEEQNKTA